VCLHCSPGHLKLPGDLGVVTALEQQFGNLLFPGTQSDRSFFHCSSPGSMNVRRRSVQDYANIRAPVAHPVSGGPSKIIVISSKIHSTQNANVSGCLQKLTRNCEAL
jgi:hypothetical protein